MQMYFSPSTNGFYCKEVNGDKIPADARKVSDELYASLRGKQIMAGVDGMPRLYVAPPPDPVAPLVAGLQAAMEAKAKAFGYDSLISVCSYTPDDPNPKFAAEGAAFRAWRSNVWTTAYAYLARVAAGEVVFPTLAEAIAMMPPLQL